MAKLYFRYGAMNSGKSTILMQVAYNYEERGMKVLVFKPAVDTGTSAVDHLFVFPLYILSIAGGCPTPGLSVGIVRLLELQFSPSKDSSKP